VLGVLPGIIGSIQAIETIKLILGKGESLVGRLLLFDALAMEFREMKIEKNSHCPVCGGDPTITQLVDYEQFCGVPFPEAAASVSRLSGKNARRIRSDAPASSRREG